MRLKVSLLALLIGASVLVSGCDFGKKKNIILIIGDGMHIEHEIAGSRYLKGKDNGLVFHKFPYKNFVTTWDVTAYNKYAVFNGADPYDPLNFDPIIGYNPELGGKFAYPFSFLETQFDYFVTNGAATDSASAATAMATGYKTDDGNIAWLPGDPEGGALRTIAEDLKDELGYAIGIVSTVPLSHATPGSFVSHNVSRGNTRAMANEIINVARPDVLITGGAIYGDSKIGSYIAQEDYDAIQADPEYVFVTRAEGVDGGDSLAAAACEAKKNNKKLFALYGGGSHGFGYAGKNGAFDAPVPANNPGSPEFVYQPENPSLAECVKSAFKLLKDDPDGFFLMVEQGDIDWANHFNVYDWMIGSVHDLDEAVKAAIEMVEKPNDDIDWSNTTIIVTADHANSYMRLSEENILGKGELPGENQADYLTYSTYGHTNEPVSIYVKGDDKFKFRKYEGVMYPGTRLIDNTNIYDFIKEITGLSE